MRPHDMLDRVLNGEPVEATEDVLLLAELAREIEDAFTDVEPTPFDSGKGLNLALEALRESAPQPVTRSRTRRVAARILVAAAMLLALPTAAWGASESALPGDLLYPVKRGFEQVRLMIATSPLDEAATLLDHAAERLGEAARARALGLDDSAEAAVDGYDDAMAGFDRRIEEARRLGFDVTQEMAVAGQLIADHDALLDALSGSTTGAQEGAASEGEEIDPPPASTGGEAPETGTADGAGGTGTEGTGAPVPAGDEGTGEIVEPEDPDGTAPEGSTSEDTASEDTASEGTASEDTESEGTTSDGTTCDETTSEEGTSDGGTTSDGTTSDGTSDGTTSDGTSETTSDGTTSDGTSCEGTSSEG
ncbi:MAG: DUF5667 domain-containing protein [Actinomycetota bacterium]